MKRCLMNFAMIFLFMLTACTPVKMPNVNTYAITNINTIKVKAPRKKGMTILVSKPIADPGYQTSAMIYMLTPYELEAFSRNRWVAPPASMLLPLFVTTLRQTGFFHAVVAPPFSGNTDLNLQLQLIKLQQEFLSPMSRVRLVMQATLFNNRSSRVIASQQFSVTVKSPGNNPYSGVLATNRAAQKVSAKIARFCLKSLRKKS